MNQILLIALGGAIGSVFRYWVSTGAYKLLGPAFPYGTLAVNVIGSFVMGLLFILLLERLNGNNEQLRALLLVGFLGGFTTFSSFSIETFHLIERGEVTSALVNIAASFVLCISATWMGVIMGRQG